MFIHPHHQFPSLSCESCLLFFWPKDFNYGWIGSKMSSVLFEGFWSLFLALHFFAFPLLPPTPRTRFLLCVFRFVFLHLLFMPLQWYFCRLYQIFKLKDLRPQLQRFSLHFPPRSTCISIYFPRACFLGFHSTLDASVNWQRPELHLCHLGVPLLRPKKKNSICYLIVAVVAVIAPQSAGFDPLWAKLVS